MKMSTSACQMKMISEHLKSIFSHAVSSVNPKCLIRNSVHIDKNNVLRIGSKTYSLLKPCYIVGFGKAVLSMVWELEDILKENIQEGVVLVPRGSLTNVVQTSQCRINIIEGAANNLPDLAAVEGSLKVKKLGTDLLIVLISGGGSALLTLPKPPITIEEKRWLVKELSLRGANIVELNAIRKKLSLLKGGGLLNMAYPARVISLILSDVINDPIDVIASGPTIRNTDNHSLIYEIIVKYDLMNKLPESIKNVLLLEEHHPADNLHNADNFIIGNNKTAMNAAIEIATNLGYVVKLISRKVSGDIQLVSEVYAEIASSVIEQMDNPNTPLNSTYLNQLIDKLHPHENALSNMFDNITFKSNDKICLLFAGEPTVNVTGSGKGGRNQHLALQFSMDIYKLRLKGKRQIVFLSAGTDGIDGLTDAAGAIGSSNLLTQAELEGLDVRTFLKNHDSYNFFRQYNSGKWHISTGHTGTNVMDLHIMIII